MSEIEQVGVVGCGQMGHGIAQVVAAAGFDVVVREVDDATLARGLAKIEQQLARAVERGKLAQAEADATKGRLRGTTRYEDLADADLVIEAVTEDLAIKLEVWRTLDAIVKPEAIFATNTSSLSAVQQAAATSRPERFAGLHFFNPAQVMTLVEVIRALTTSPETYDAVLAWASALPGKLAIPTRDSTGFIVNRLLIPYILDAMRAFEEGVGSVTEIDAAMKAGAGHPMGPLALSDLIGNDVTGAVATSLFDEFRERRFAQPPILRKLLAAGWLGRKSGLGFYDYAGDEPVANPALATR